MKRLVQISFDTLLLSIIPIVIWNALGLILSKDLVVTFSITYPIQFLFSIFYYIFAVGPNITAEKKKDKNIVYSNIFLGILVGTLILLILIFKCNIFLLIMNVNVSVFRIFTIYSLFNIFYSYVLKLVLEKLYYEKENKIANLISILFNIVNLILVVVLAIITKSQYITSIITLITMGFLLLIILFLNIKKFKINILLLDNIKNSSIGIVENISMFIIYFFGHINSYSFGMEYILASTFVGIVSDTQWDMIYAIQTAVHIDVSKEKFSERYGQEFSYDKYKKEMSDLFHANAAGGKLPKKPGLQELLEYLRRENIKTAVASSTRRELVTRELKEGGLLSYFDEIVCGDMVKRSKPEPDIYLEACRRLQERSEDCYAIEDSYNGIRSAKRAGMHPIMVPDQAAPTEEMEELADCILTSLYEVQQYIDKNNKKIEKRC